MKPLVLHEGLNRDDRVTMRTAQDDQPDSAEVLDCSGKFLDGLFAVRAPHRPPLRIIMMEQ